MLIVMAVIKVIMTTMEIREKATARSNDDGDHDGNEDNDNKKKLLTLQIMIR